MCLCLFVELAISVEASVKCIRNLFEYALYKFTLYLITYLLTVKSYNIAQSMST